MQCRQISDDQEVNTVPALHRVGGEYNPADYEFNAEEAVAVGARTTLMIRNIPNK